MIRALLLSAVILACSYQAYAAKRPHILLIVADDYGWNDIGYHGSKQVNTPYLDELAAEGIKLENYYVLPVCTPTRSTLLSGKYVTHTGLQHLVIFPCQPSGMPLEDKTIADQLKSLGYNTSMIGKWHLGDFKKDYLPTRRGFDSFFGYLNGAEDYYNHTICNGKMCGVDLYDDEEPTDIYRGQYSANLFINRARHLIDDHNVDNPLFLYMAFQSVHAPLQAPKYYTDQFTHIEDPQRRTYLAMVKALDDGVQNITLALKAKGMWEDTLVIFTTDNGGMVVQGGNNMPLRGSKATLYEGGVRGVSFVSGPRATESGKINHQLMHVSDWYPTILNAAGGDASKVPGLDGYDQWDTIVKNSTSKRDEIMINIDPENPRFGKSMSDVFDTGVQAALRQGDWKIITGPPQVFPGWFEEPTQGSAAKILNNLEQMAVGLVPAAEYALAIALDQAFGYQLPVNNVQLFNIAEDPEERNEISAQHPEIVEHLLERLAAYNKTAVPVQWPAVDNNCNPQEHNGYWGPWE